MRPPLPLRPRMIPLFGWQVAALSRSSWPAAQGTTVTPDPPGAAGDPGWRWHGHKSVGTEHVEALKEADTSPAACRRATSLPSFSTTTTTTAAPFLSLSRANCSHGNGAKHRPLLSSGRSSGQRADSGLLEVAHCFSGPESRALSNVARGG